MNEDMNERQAIEHLSQGDVCGLETLVRAYQQRALRTAYLITLDRLLAEDIVQTAFLQAYEQIHTFDTRRASEPWFLQIVINASLQAATRRNRDLRLDSAADAHAPAHVDMLSPRNHRSKNWPSKMKSVN